MDQNGCGLRLSQIQTAPSCEPAKLYAKLWAKYLAFSNKFNKYLAPLNYVAAEN